MTDHPITSDLSGPFVPSAGEGVLTDVLGAFREQGYGDGYRKGARDVLTHMLEAAEAYLFDHPELDTHQRSSLRGVMRALEAEMERRLEVGLNRMYVEGGLGI